MKLLLNQVNRSKPHDAMTVKVKFKKNPSHFSFTYTHLFLTKIERDWHVEEKVNQTVEMRCQINYVGCRVEIFLNHIRNDAKLKKLGGGDSK